MTQLGFGPDTRPLSVLRAMMRIQSTPSRSLDVSEIHGSLLRAEPGTALSKGWVRKVLDQLSNMQMIRVENESESRKKYISDINTIVAGLEQLKGRTLSSLEKRRAALQARSNELSAFNFSDVARVLEGKTAGRAQQPNSGLLKGLQSYADFADAEIYEKAVPGDVIRIAQLQLRPFRGGITEGVNRTLRAAESGAEVRCLVTVDVLSADDFLAEVFPENALVEFFVKAYGARQKGLKLDLRIDTGHTGLYHLTSLNKDNMVILVSEDPMAAMWVSRRFNPDLIEAAIASFEQIWQGLTPLIQDPKHPELGVPTTKPSFFLEALKAAATIVASGGT
ncbi:MAG: hypothetical protein C4K47_09260 [Candidatus Thorarchaeota archaeon]|nr:MAG: hypothetical protein C4K47_09260 [Candidatus Thorarchaeota archaeon]